MASRANKSKTIDATGAMDLSCAIQNYEWGKKGKYSKVAQLVNGDIIKSTTPYAELWMGTHPNGPSCIKDSNEPLLTYIKKDPNRHLGPDVMKTFGSNLPFLLKVLSIENPLSIQVHPNKEQAKKLHATQPNIYKDPNHKPELAIALGDFQALCAFRPFAEIQSLAKVLKFMIQPLYGEENLKRLLKGPEHPDIIKSCFEHLLRQNKDTIHTAVIGLLTHVDSGDECMDNECKIKPGSYTNPKWLETHQISLLRRLNDLYPGDPGCIAIYLLNVLNLKRFDAIFLAANVPHAYLLGDCVEIMACSDNVVRAGLTPKLVDIQTLVEMLDYTPRNIKSLLFTPNKDDEYTEIFRPPVNDFAIAKIQIPKGSKHDLIKRSTATIVLIIEGEGTTTNNKVIKMGMSFFLSANDDFKVTSAKTDLLIFQAMANV